MRRAFLFNPENDIALARNVAAFTPPPAAVALRRAGELLSMWLCREGDGVICDGVNTRWFDRITSDFGLPARPWDHGTADTEPMPWGWSAAVRRSLAQRGFPAESMPDDRQLADIRELSHRRTAATVARVLAEKLPFEVWPAAVEVSDPAQLTTLLRQGPCVVKAPWSSSGRGISFTTPDRADSAAVRAAGVIRKQGSVMVERAADRICDFAMLWDYGPDGCDFAGYSLFETDGCGDYRANTVAPQPVLESRIAALAGADRLQAIRVALPDALRSAIGDRYAGPLGIDMLIAADGTVDPVVEINFRYTMGFIALALEPYTASEARFTAARGDITATCAYTAADGRLISGCLPLSQPGCAFTFTLEIL